MLKGAAVLAALPVVGFSCTTTSRAPVVVDPFTLGVASGEPTPTAWCYGRGLRRDLLPTTVSAACRGGRRGGVGGRRPTSDSARIVQRGSATAVPETAHSVHVEWTGLRPGGSTSTVSAPAVTCRRPGEPAPRPRPDRSSALTMCVASCSHYEQGWFTAYRRLAEEQPDLILHLGDYQYEYAAASAPGARSRRARNGHAGRLPAAARAVQDRPRSAGGARRRAVAGGVRRPRGGEQLGRRRARASPTRRSCARRPRPSRRTTRTCRCGASALPRGIDMQLYRRVHWGALATFHMLDTRQYRTDQPAATSSPPTARSADSAGATLTGASRSGGCWTAFALARAVGRPGPAGVLRAGGPDARACRRSFNPDCWDGYTANRDRIIAGHASLAGAQRGGAHR